MDSELEAAINSAKAAQRRALRALDRDIEVARTQLQATKFTSDAQEVAALKKLTDLLEQRLCMGRHLNAA